jgi:Uma2 family endonuclease
MAAPGFVIPLESVKRFSLDEYHRLGQSGVLPRHTELLEGILVNKMTLSPRHRLIVNKFRHILEKLLPPSFVILQEGPLTIGDSEPEPDLSILEGSYDDFATAHPRTAAWVIEVAGSSYALDREKRTLYARAEIPEYWILDLDRNRVIVFSQPVQGGYEIESVLTAADRIPLPVAPGHSIALVDLG